MTCLSFGDLSAFFRPLVLHILSHLDHLRRRGAMMAIFEGSIIAEQDP